MSKFAITIAGEPATKTDITKFCVKLCVAAGISGATHRVVTDHTDINPESKWLEAGTAVFGYAAASQLKPVTDKGVDAVLGTVQSRREKRREKKIAKLQAKKNNTESQ